MADNVVEIKIAATGVSEAGAQFEGFSDEVKAALQAISASAGVTAGDLNILQAVMKAEQDAGIALSATLKDVAGANGVFSTAVRDAAEAVSASLTPAVASVIPPLQEVPPILDEIGFSALRARGAAMELGREIGIPLPRAITSLAAQSATLGPILAAAFPIITVVLLGEEAIKLIDKLDKVSAAEKRAAEEAKKFSSELAALGREMQHLQQQEFTDLFGKTAGDAKNAADLVNGQLASDTAKIGLLRAEIARQQQKAVPTVSDMGDTNDEDVKAAKIELTTLTRQLDIAEIEQAKHQMEAAHLSHESLTGQVADSNRQTAAADRSATAQEQAYKKTEAAIKAADLARLDSFKNAAAAQGHVFSDADELTYYEGLLAVESRYKDRKAELDHEISRLTQSVLKEDQKAEEEAAKEQEAIDDAINKDLVLGRDRQIKEHIRQMAEESKAMAAEEKKRAEEQKKADLEARKLKAESIAFDSTLKLGGLQGKRADLENQKGEDSTPGAELQRLAAVRDVDRQIVQEKTQTALANAALYRDDPIKFGEAIKEEVKINEEGQRQIAKDTAAIQKEVQKDVTAVVHEIGDDFTKNVNKWITGQESFGKAMQGVWKDLATTAITSIEHIIEKQIEQMVIQRALKALGVDTSNSGQQQANNQKIAAGNAGLASSDAALGAAGIFAYTLAEGGNLPDALEQAAIALAIGESFAGLASVSAMSGADLPNHNTLGFLHPREMVLPQSHADVIRGLAANGGARSSSSNVNVGSVNYRGAQMSDKHFGAMVKRLQRNANQ